VHRGNERRQRGSWPAKKGDQRPREPPSNPSDVAAHVHPEAEVREPEDAKGGREEEREEKERYSSELALERTTHGLSVDGERVVGDP
jgi:hypothetical protein